MLAELEQWVQQPDEGGSEVLTGRLEQLLGSIQEAARGIQQDLGARPAAPEFGELLTGSAVAYGDLEECLEEILAAIPARDRAQVQAELLYLKAAMSSLRQYTDAIEQWLAAPILRCPRCGATDGDPEEICRHCDLELLYPDLQPDTRASREFITLGAEYVAVYRTYLGVLAGERPLADLGPPLHELLGWLEPYLKISRLTREPGLVEQLQAVEQGCRQVQAGVEQMSSCFEGRETSDLNEGWRTIFEAGAELQRLMPQLLQDLGVASESHTGSGGDVVEFSE